ncbi:MULTISPECIES: methionine ABC transporter ATP-binding protein [Citricoccus]|uniref:Methionine ABC transporter ATP-binding protein n=1 Tax=Citricoccus muralis TaxID=169134 RepID=A0ABY8H4Q8_9MICC|nr:MULTISPECIES: methionine ABC transporter ATP-binding protein [Citricoccus]WBL20322.1 methionine ABC transporter ATP-binding protein [Citricoccus sp. NR2]WFP16129.1 methionine ABC transporter ATP-binding protein [Citricoccus muralis]
MAHISLKGVSKVYPAPRRGFAETVAVDDVTLDIERGDVFGIIGYSGAGKSTLVRLINALEPVTAGSITIDGVDITAQSASKQRAMRTGIGMIFQRFNLLSSRSVRRNVEYSLEVAGMGRSERKKRALELLDFVGLADKAGAFPEQLSGGQQQRVGIARALAADPPILLADEATSALDPETTDEVLDLLARVNRELGITIVVITHEMDVIARIANKVAVMERGQVVETGNTYDVFTNPQTATAKRFVRTVVRNLPSGDELTELRSHHEGRLFTISFTDEGVSEARVFGALARAGVDFNLVYGGVDSIQGRVYGLLTIAVRGDATAVDQAVGSIGSSVKVEEVFA